MEPNTQRPQISQADRILLAIHEYALLQRRCEIKMNKATALFIC